MIEPRRAELDNIHINDWSVSARLIPVISDLQNVARHAILETLKDSNPVLAERAADNFFALTFDRLAVTEKVAVNSGIVAIWDAFESAGADAFRVLSMKLINHDYFNLVDNKRDPRVIRDVTLQAMNVELAIDRLRDTDFSIFNEN